MNPLKLLKLAVAFALVMIVHWIFAAMFGKVGGEFITLDTIVGLLYFRKQLARWIFN